MTYVNWVASGHERDNGVLNPPPRASGNLYTCPMHAEIRQDQPGNCPKCGMTLEPVMPELGAQDDSEALTSLRQAGLRGAALRQD